MVFPWLVSTQPTSITHNANALKTLLASTVKNSWFWMLLFDTWVFISMIFNFEILGTFLDTFLVLALVSFRYGPRIYFV